MPKMYEKLRKGAFAVLFFSIFPLGLVGEQQTELNSVGKTLLENTETKSAQKIETFILPKAKTLTAPSYPRRAQRDEREGWVSVNFMVDSHGKPYEISVHGYSSEVFVGAAKRAVEKWNFEPALIDGRAIEAAVSYRMTFELSGATQASNSFGRTFKSVIKAVASKDQEAAQLLLDKMKNKKSNLYEEAFYWLSKYYFAQTWQDTSAQYRALNRALFRDSSNKYFLPDKSIPGLLLNQLGLEVKQNYLRNALDTSVLLDQYTLSPRDLNYLEKIVSQIKQIKNGDGIVIVKGSISGDNSFYHLLLKSRFRFSEVSGDIAELRLRCEKGYVGFVYQKEITFEVDGKAGECSLQVIGDPGTTFKLLEL